MYAVVRTGGKQYRVEPGQEFLVEKLDAKAGQSLELKDVLLCHDGKQATIGTPLVPASVQCLIVRHEKGPKLRTIKYKRRKNYKRTLGHRQDYTRLLVQTVKKGN